MVKGSLPGHFEGQEKKADPSHVPKDKGCEKAKELGYYGPCTECTIDPCLEEGGAFWRAKILKRDGIIVDMIQEGKSVKEIAEQLGVSIRTVERTLEGRNPKLMSG